MNKRIQEILDDNHLTTRVFADMIGVTSSSVSKLTSGVNKPSERTIRLICDKFNLNREWLETGEGEKFKQADDSLITKFGSLMATGSENKKELVRMILDMPDELFDAFYEYMVNAHSK
jgi:transcriptional regulator with XRE-family HTH domain